MWKTTFHLPNLLHPLAQLLKVVQEHLRVHVLVVVAVARLLRLFDKRLSDPPALCPACMQDHPPRSLPRRPPHNVLFAESRATRSMVLVAVRLVQPDLDRVWLLLADPLAL